MAQSIIVRKSTGNTLTIRASNSFTTLGGVSSPATTATIGGVIVGTGLTVQANGLLTANGTANLPFANLTSLPSTLASHGITDGLTTTTASSTYALISSLASYLTTSNASSTYSVLGHNHTIPNVTGLQTALDGKQACGSYVLTSNSALTDARTPLAHTQAFSTITNTPITLGGYGIADALPSANFTYANITGKPTLANVATSGSYNDLTSTPNLTLYLTTSNASSTYATQYTTISNGTGLTGGGSLAANRTLAIDSTVATLAGTQTLTNKTLGATSVNGTMSFLGNITTQLQLQSWRETFTSPTIASGVLTLDLSASNFFKVSLNAAITSITITGVPASSASSFSLEFTADGTARAVTWPAAFKWTGGTAPTLTSTSGKTDTFVFYTTDTGVTWKAYVAGQNQ